MEPVSRLVDWWHEVTLIRPAAKRAVKIFEEREAIYKKAVVCQRSEMVMPLLYLLDRIEAENNPSLARERFEILKDHGLVIEYEDGLP